MNRGNMNKETLNNINILDEVNFEKRYVVIITIVMIMSAIVLIGLILFGNLSNNYNNYIMFLVISLVDGCVFVDIVSNLLPQTMIHMKNKKEEK